MNISEGVLVNTLGLNNGARHAGIIKRNVDVPLVHNNLTVYPTNMIHGIVDTVRKRGTREHINYVVSAASTVGFPLTVTVNVDSRDGSTTYHLSLPNCVQLGIANWSLTLNHQFVRDVLDPHLTTLSSGKKQYPEVLFFFDARAFSLFFEILGKRYSFKSIFGSRQTPYRNAMLWICRTELAKLDGRISGHRSGFSRTVLETILAMFTGTTTEGKNFGATECEIRREVGLSGGLPLTARLSRPTKESANKGYHHVFTIRLRRSKHYGIAKASGKSAKSFKGPPGKGVYLLNQLYKERPGVFPNTAVVDRPLDITAYDKVPVSKPLRQCTVWAHALLPPDYDLESSHPQLEEFAEGFLHKRGNVYRITFPAIGIVDEPAAEYLTDKAFTQFDKVFKKVSVQVIRERQELTEQIRKKIGASDKSSVGTSTGAGTSGA
ncbi:hypothetical protein JCM11641_004611 [Rhodosporidiobolus odoratus]